MTEFFKRRAIVSFGPANIGIAQSTRPRIATIDGLRVTFEIDKTSESSPNPAKISMYNLSKDSRHSIEQGLSCFLAAGYDGLDGAPLISQIFAGDVSWLHTDRNGPDVVTTVECRDAETALRNVHIEQSFGPGTTVQQVVSTVAGKMGLSIGTIVSATKGIFQHGYSFSGLASDALDHLTKMAGLEWHVTDSEINVLDPNLPTADPPINLNSYTGLIGYPSKNQIGVIQFKSLLNPGMRPGRAVYLTSATYTGLVRCRLCKFHGDTHGGEFSVAVEAYPL